MFELLAMDASCFLACLSYLAGFKLLDFGPLRREKKAAKHTSLTAVG